MASEGDPPDAASPPSGLEIREPTEDERPAVADRLLRPSYRASEAVDPEYNALDEAAVADADCSRWLDQEDRTLFVAVVDGDLAGHVSAIETEAPPIYDRGTGIHVDGLYVAEPFRRQGIASKLLDRIEAWGRERGAKHVGVTVHVDNEAAGRLYEGRYERRFQSYRSRLE